MQHYHGCLQAPVILPEMVITLGSFLISPSRPITGKFAEAKSRRFIYDLDCIFPYRSYSKILKIPIQTTCENPLKIKRVDQTRSQMEVDSPWSAGGGSRVSSGAPVMVESPISGGLRTEEREGNRGLRVREREDGRKREQPRKGEWLPAVCSRWLQTEEEGGCGDLG
ncbi:hypothetical protein L1887_08077 [Cichorium endivia]|nr:hypothetical protein L1887_08077 [Cichorium endivia]